MENKLNLEADIQILEETSELKKTVAAIIDLPEKGKNADLLFFSGIFVSTGENLNHAFFLPSELVKAASTINNKAIDLEHNEDQIYGHIYASAFVDNAGNKLDVAKLEEMGQEELESKEIDIIISGIIYKSRFPEIAKEVADNKWKLSMETFYQDYDIKIGNMIMSRKEAETLGFAAENLIGKIARVVKAGKEVARDKVTRVLRELLFSGCGLVKNPANPRSIILETAKKKGEGDDIVISLDGTEVDQADEKEGGDKEVSDINTIDIRRQTSVGICVSYKKRIIDSTFRDPNSTVTREDWCTLYDKACTSASRDAHHPDCLRRKVLEKTKAYTASKLEQLEKADKRGDLLSKLQDALKKVGK